MTDPFKNQRYSTSSANLSSPGSNPLNASFSKSFANPSNPVNQLELDTSNFNRRQNKIAVSNSMNDIKKVLEVNTSTHPNPPFKSATTPVNDAFVSAHIEANKELIANLKANIELLFRGSRILGHFVLYPFKVLRWQCQINSESNKYHLTPFTLMPVFFNLNFHGYATLWKGCFSMTAYNGSKIILESVLGEVTPFEKNIENVNQLEKLYGHLLLKFLSCAITTPIYAAVVFESVQSGISNENLGILDLLRETWNRVTGYKYNYRTRLIPFWSLILPTSFYFVGVHAVSYSLEKIIEKLIVSLNRLLDERRRDYYEDEIENDVIKKPYIETISQLSSQLAALTLFYPVETILNRLIVQGTRTIIDNTDNGYGVVPINTRYDGFLDCASMIHETEGICGFYKGFGVLLVETMLTYAIFKMAKIVAYRIFDSEWTTRSDQNKIQNLLNNDSRSVVNSGVLQMDEVPRYSPRLQYQKP